jgi:hypothetical protein
MRAIPTEAAPLAGGFGRIGRLAFRLAYACPEFEFVHINESPAGNAVLGCDLWFGFRV